MVTCLQMKMSYSIFTIMVTCFCAAVTNRIGAVMVIVLASSAVDRGLEPRSGQTKDYKIVLLLR
jgi:hypothetical protein